MNAALNPGIYYQGQMRTGAGGWSVVTPTVKTISTCIEDMESVGFKLWKSRNIDEARIIRIIVEEA